ncbi:MAG TPA: tRNA (adenosine(37)-N6)-threonylcarbamoyltransferase complex dimerization subunit type 1 TsaB, partial [Bacillota bacterium]
MSGVYERVLGIDTAGVSLAVGLYEASGLRIERLEREPLQHSRRLVAVIRDVLATAAYEPRDIDLISVSEGPGSYTGLRIGAVAAKVLAWTAQAAVVGVDALAVRAANVQASCVIAGLPARRGQIYARAYSSAARGGEEPEPLTDLLEGPTETVLVQLAAAIRGRWPADQRFPLDAGGEAVIFVGEGFRELPYADLAARFGERAQLAPADADHPRGTVVARLGRARALRQQALDPLQFLPR